ncbi:TlpA disulfide reductase family protein [Telluribacter sp. SYSU D00476]|uniref:TlpA family protein disulfide reductase n=1 Tax=Telluribacter sp. SYSU D00476 TaxID=2811430 RepID=UPI001FF215E4|nr:TlpA disulfide reductase family protein [Telluribacter sp. SYSU D00476]
MKSLIPILCTIISILFVESCVSSSKEDKTQINISCRECAGMEVSLNISTILPTGPKEIYKSQFDSSGRARIEFIQNDTLDASLVVGESKFFTTLYLEPRSTIDLTIENGLPTFEGDLKIINAYYNKIDLNAREGQEYVNANYARYVSASSSEQQVYLDSLTTFGTELKNQIEKDKSISNHYRKILIDKLSLFGITQRMHFDTQFAYKEISNNDMSVVLDSTLSGAFKDVSLHPNFINYPSYTRSLSNRLGPIFDDILNYHYDNGVKTDKYEYVKGAIVKDARLNDYQELLLALFVAHMSYDSRMDYDLEVKLIDLFQKDYPDSKYLKGLNYILADYHELKSGMPMKDLEMRDINEKAFSVSSLKGNLVYIDVWATWCGPCVDELEYSKKLSKRYSNHPDLKFLYVSIDEDTERWKKFLRKNSQIKGLHGLQNSEFVADSNMITSLYKISGIPRYILISKDGNIITANAKRPSELVSNNYLDSLLAL